MSSRFIGGIATQSLGCPQHHNLHEKLQATALAGLSSVEIFFEDIRQLVDAVKSDPSILSPPLRTNIHTQDQDRSITLACARQIRHWCTSHNLSVICLQPMMHFEGCDLARRKANFERLDFWIEIAHCLGTDLIQIPSNFLPADQCTGDRTQIIADLKEAAEIGARQTPPIRFAYEALCWGTHVDTWDAAWEIVEAVDMDNFGTCLDTFNLAGRVYANPTSVDGLNEHAALDIDASIQKLREVFSKPKNLKKIFYLELCDGEVLEEPISEQHEWYTPEQKPRMTWSRNARLWPFETDVAEAQAQNRGPGYLPVTEIFDTLLDLGFEGYLSFEVFNRSLNRGDPYVIKEHQLRARTSWQKCLEHIEAFFAEKAARNAVTYSSPTVVNSSSKAGCWPIQPRL